MHLARGMNPSQFGDNEWEAYLGVFVSQGDGRGGSAEGSGGSGANAPSWVEDERRPAAARLKSSFPGMTNSAQLDDGGLWSTFYGAEECEREFPVQTRDRLKPFQRVLLVQALRPDRLVSSMELFACEALGMKGVEQLSPAAVALRDIVRETRAAEPVLVVISPGSDPSEELRSLAATMRVPALHEVAMGQGQAEVAIAKLRQAAAEGHWVFLKNLHLMTFWIPTLEKELSSLTPSDNFRLWLTAEPHPKFSATLSETCLKVTYEAPPGVKRNLQRTLAAWGSEAFSRGSPSRARSLFALAWFHAIAQERRTFIPQVGGITLMNAIYFRFKNYIFRIIFDYIENGIV